MSPGLASLVAILHFHCWLITPSSLSIPVNNCSGQGLFTAAPLSFVTSCPKANDDNLHAFLFTSFLLSPGLVTAHSFLSNIDLPACSQSLAPPRRLRLTLDSRLLCLQGLETYHHQSGPLQQQPECSSLDQTVSGFTGPQTQKSNRLNGMQRGSALSETYSNLHLGRSAVRRGGPQRSSTLSPPRPDVPCLCLCLKPQGEVGRPPTPSWHQHARGGGR